MNKIKFLLVFCFMLCVTLIAKAENSVTVQEVPKAPSVEAVQSFNETWTSTNLNKTHIFNIGSFSWLSITAGHIWDTSKEINIRFMDSSGNYISDSYNILGFQVPAGQGYSWQFDSDDLPPSVRKIEVHVKSSAISVGVSTLWLNLIVFLYWRLFIWSRFLVKLT